MKAQQQMNQADLMQRLRLCHELLGTDGIISLNGSFEQNSDGQVTTRLTVEFVALNNWQLPDAATAIVRLIERLRKEHPAVAIPAAPITIQLPQTLRRKLLKPDSGLQEA